MGDINPSIFQFHRAFYTRQRMMIMTREISREMTLRRKKKKERILIAQLKNFYNFLRSKNY